MKNDQITRLGAIGIYFLIATSLRYLFVVSPPALFNPIVNTLVYKVLTGVGPLVGALFVLHFIKRKSCYSTFGCSTLKSCSSASIPAAAFLLFDLFTGNQSLSNTLIVITCLIYAYCEEFGWRGYLQSELLGLSELARCAIITTLWFLWHLNFAFSISNLLFLLLLFFGSWGIGRIAIRTNSIIACACFHAIINIAENIPLNFSTILLLTICIGSWIVIWYYKREPAEA